MAQTVGQGSHTTEGIRESIEASALLCGVSMPSWLFQCFTMMLHALGADYDYCSCLCQDALDALVDMREYDVPYHMRFQIDTDVRCGHWFTVTAKVKHPPGLDFLRRTDLLGCTQTVCSSLACLQVQIQTASLW